MNLVKAELNRLFSRRFPQILLLLLFVVFGLTVATVLLESSTPTEFDWQQARQQAAEERTYLEGARAECLARSPNGDCGVFNPANVRTENYLYSAFVFSRSIEPLLFFLAAYLGVFGFLIAASFIGSEMSSGGMINLLLWRPERTRVLGAKLAVILGVITAFGLVFSALYIGVFYLLAESIGWAGTPAWDRILLLGLRGVLLAVAFAVVAFAISTVARHTVAAIGVLFGYILVWEAGVRIMTSITSRHGGNQPQMFLSTHVVAWLDGQYHYYGCSRMIDYDQACDQTITWWQGGLVIGVLTVALLAIAAIHFRRRDLI